ncbi:hypothetical protein MSAN_01882900 [Mycena sanguinolenta]|uniref:C2H2-type domain-containing protein n=1 Tax=Mycena sanguinolenta TaxID=230812 RepID=A0A8H6XR88_9AGAR|nr:hypothetical protein MSAN_01882900 [Mycena sanguinolenta]
MSSIPSGTVSCRRPSLAMLYNNLKAQIDPYEELESAAHLFPVDEPKVLRTCVAPSEVFNYSPSPSPFTKTDDESDSDSKSDSSSDSDSDVEPLDLNATEADSVMIYNDPPFIPPRQQSPIITQTFEIASARKPASRTPPSPRVSPPPAFHSRQPKRILSPVADEDSDGDADCESTADVSEDDAPPLPRPPARPPSAPASVRACPPPSRNIQATTADEIQRVEDTSDDFVCRVCGWVQKNQRLPDFKRHVKTHQRAFDEGAEKGWRCKGVLVSEAADWALGPDAPTYTFLGQERVGGCMKTFSRRDALKRHLDNCNVTCVGRPTAPSND